MSNTVDPDELRLDSETQSPHYIWIAGTTQVCGQASGCETQPACYDGQDCHTVKRFDTQTNELLGVYSSWGWSPSRTAVAVDNSVWVGNRGCRNTLSNCEADNPMHGNAVHLDADGGLICRADVVGSAGSVAVRAVTIDKDGNAWLGSWDDRMMYKYSGDQVDNTHPDGIPRCVKLCSVNLNVQEAGEHQGASRAYGAAVDSNGFLWISTLNEGPVRKIDTATCQITKTVNTGYQTYGLAIDKNDNPWFGCWNGSCGCGVIKVDGQTGQVHCIARTQGTTSGGQTRGVAVDQDGNIWIAEWSHHSISKYSPAGVHLGQWSVDPNGEARGPLGVAVDFDNVIWAINYTSGHASKFATDGTLLDVFSVGNTPYTYSDMTGYQLRSITLKHGTWTVDFDSGYTDAQWDKVEFSGTMGQDDRIRIRVRSAPTQGDLVKATFSAYLDANWQDPSPWSVSLAGVVPANRWIQVEVTLNTQDDVSPAFSGLQVFWQR